jgi:hypothetical protein
MYRKDADRKVCGVLNDFDHSSCDIANRSIVRKKTGTIPFMAVDFFNDL